MNNKTLPSVATVTPANVTDAKAMKYVCPSSGAVVADKGYCIGEAKKLIKKKGLGDLTIKKNNMIGKNRDKDRFISKLRSPYEGFFSNIPKRVRYKGLAKNNFSFLMQSMVFNIKLLTKLNAPPLFF